MEPTQNSNETREEFSAEAQDDFPAEELAKLVMASGSFDWLTDEPDIYDATCGEPV